MFSVLIYYTTTAIINTDSFILLSMFIQTHPRQYVYLLCSVISNSLSISLSPSLIMWLSPHVLSTNVLNSNMYIVSWTLYSQSSAISISVATLWLLHHFISTNIFIIGTNLLNTNVHIVYQPFYLQCQTALCIYHSLSYYLSITHVIGTAVTGGRGLFCGVQNRCRMYCKTIKFCT